MSDKYDQEEDYFARIDREKKAALKAKLDAEAGEKALADRKALHYLKCGKCGGDMAPKLFKGVEIDLCGDCGSVLLDPGELEELAGEEGHVLSNIAELLGFKRQPTDEVERSGAD
jgi:hypothetical protein